MSPHLIEFLTAWKDWAESGAPEEKPFSHWTGLCYNYYEYLLDRNITDFDNLVALRVELLKQFHGADYPFGGKEQYFHERRTSSRHRNPARLAFVNSILAGVK